MNTLLLASAVTVVATYLGTEQQQPTYKDKIFQLRQDAKQKESKEIVDDSYTTRKGSSTFYLNSKKTSRERYVRNLLESMFRYKFPSVRPKWLKNPKTGRNMEIDCYCKEMSLCVEVDGIQHNKYLPYFHKKGYQEFLDMRERDFMKTILCKKRGMKLVRLPHNVHDQDIEAYLLQQINKVMK